MVTALGFADSRSIVQLDPGSTAPRRIAHRTGGRRHGPVTRLMSPGDIGEMVKPFVFLDYFSVEDFTGAGFAAHPHSGIATHTTLLQGTFDYGDSTGKVGQMPPDSIEWMQAGGGVWHWGNPRGGEPVRGVSAVGRSARAARACSGAQPVRRGRSDPDSRRGAPTSRGACGRTEPARLRRADRLLACAARGRRALDVRSTAGDTTSPGSPPTKASST